MAQDVDNSSDNGQYLLEFQTHLVALNRSPRTIESYVGNVGRYLDFISTNGIESAVDVACEDLEKYQAHLLCKPENTIVTVDTYMRSVRAFYKFLLRQDYIITNPSELVPLPKMPRQLPRNVLTEKEVADLLNAPDIKTDEGILHRAVMELFYSAGLRLAELCNLKLHDVDTAAGVVHVNKGKGAKDRTTPIGNSACLWTRAYRELVRPNLSCDASKDFLFLGSQLGHPINQLIVERFVKRYAKQAGITKKVSPHVLRSTCATHLLKNGMSLLQVRDFLGHSLVSTTERYTKITPKQLIEAHRKFHPRSKK